MILGADHKERGLWGSGDKNDHNLFNEKDDHILFTND